MKVAGLFLQATESAPKTVLPELFSLRLLCLALRATLPPAAEGLAGAPCAQGYGSTEGREQS